MTFLHFPPVATAFTPRHPPLSRASVLHFTHRRGLMVVMVVVVAVAAAGQ